MKIVLTHTIAADRERVFDALVDPAVIQRCIPGVESMVETAPDTYDAALKIGIAGLKGSYTGRTTITNKQRPESLTLGLEGKGGPGFVRGTAALALTSDDGGTRIACDADVRVGGLIAAVGSRLIEAAARKMAADFFAAFEHQISGR
jgi:carbon monoxide dehydrogenase subunit G